MPETNPYQPPRADVAEEDFESIRRAHLSTEGNIKLVGAAVFVLAVLNGLLFVYSAFRSGVTSFLIGLPTAGISGGLLVLLGRAIRAFSPAARIVLSILVGPIIVLLINGTDPVIVVCTALLAGIFLFVFWSPKANVVFSQQYRGIVIPATRDMKTLS